jgi:hypothetical protein
MDSIHKHVLKFEKHSSDIRNLEKALIETQHLDVKSPEMINRGILIMPGISTKLTAHNNV